MYKQIIGDEARELKVIAKTLQNAWDELAKGEHPVAGRLCEDVASLGFGQEVAIEHLFPEGRRRRSERATLLASMVCENCVGWIGCDKYVQNPQPMDDEYRFRLRYTFGAVWDQPLVETEATKKIYRAR